MHHNQAVPGGIPEDSPRDPLAPKIVPPPESTAEHPVAEPNAPSGQPGFNRPVNFQKNGEVYDAARNYVATGLSVVPIRKDGTKAPPIAWKEFQTQGPTQDQLRNWFDFDQYGVAIVAGRVSGDLEVLDFDDPEAFTHWIPLVEEVAPGLLARLPQVKTPGGYHLYYRCAAVKGSQKLAMRPGEKDSTLIETRGEASYVIAPGSPPSVHETGIRYQHVAGPPLTEIPAITSEEHEILLQTARLLDERPPELVSAPPEEPAPVGKSSTSNGALRPGDDFNQRATWAEILEPAGWQRAGAGSGATSYWRRPGKPSGVSATTDFHDGWLICFSTSTDFETHNPRTGGRRAYSKFDVYAILNHQGDFRAAARTLAQEGYGEPAKVVPDRIDPATLQTRLQTVLEQLRQNPREPLKILLDSAALETFVHVAESNSAEFERTCEQLQMREHVLAKAVKTLRDEVKARQRQHAAARPNDAAEPILVADVLSDVPEAPDCLVPEGWRLSEKGVERIVPTRGEMLPQLVSPSPLLIRQRFRDADTHEERIELGWHRDGRWQFHTASRGLIANHRTIVTLAEIGFPATSTNASALVDYLAAFEAANQGRLTPQTSVAHLGWLANEQGFLIGKNFIPATSAGEPAAPFRLICRVEDQGAEQFADGFHTAGTWEGWLEAVRLAVPYPHALFGMYASLASPLLRILKASGFVMNWCASTSSGKTTTLELAAACWGDPDPGQPATVVQVWNATRTFLERRLGFLNGLPFILDDTQLAPKNLDLTRQVYDLSAGQGKGRASVDGTRSTGHWQSLLLSSGERRLTDQSVSEGGASVRALEISGSPFGEKSAATAAMVQQIKSALRSHYGHAGPRFMKFILARRDAWPTWRSQVRQYQNEFAAKFRAASPDRNNHVGDRLTGHLAVLQVAVDLAHEALNLPWSPLNVWEALKPFVLDGAESADRAAFALQRAVEHARTNPQAYWDSAQLETKSPPTGWFGRWDRSGTRTSIGFTRAALEAVFAPYSLPVDTIVRQWRDHGWLDLPTGSGRLQKNVRFAGSKGEPLSLYVLTPEAIEATGGLSDEWPEVLPLRPPAQRWYSEGGVGTKTERFPTP